MKKYFVYVLLDPNESGDFTYRDYQFDNKPKYVGKGCGNRPMAHIKEALESNLKPNEGETKVGWIKGLLEAHKHPIIHIIEDDLTETEAFLLEYSLIMLIGRVNINRGPLLNVVNGHFPIDKLVDSCKDEFNDLKKEYLNMLSSLMEGYFRRKKW